MKMVAKTHKKTKMPMPKTFKPTPAKSGVQAHATHGMSSKKPAGRSSAK